MGTQITPELSENNKYYISKHRYYELLHFCRQYDEYQLEKTRLLDTYVRPSLKPSPYAVPNGDHTEKWAMKLADVDDKIQMIEECAIQADEELSSYILMAVSGGIGYDIINARYGVPCSRNTFYDRYRKFFWLLDKRR